MGWLRFTTALRNCASVLRFVTALCDCALWLRFVTALRDCALRVAKRSREAQSRTALRVSQLYNYMIISCTALHDWSWPWDISHHPMSRPLNNKQTSSHEAQSQPQSTVAKCSCEAQSQSAVTKHSREVQSRSAVTKCSREVQSWSAVAKRSCKAQSQSAVAKHSCEVQLRIAVTKRSREAQSWIAVIKRTLKAQSWIAVTKRSRKAQSRSTVVKLSHKSQLRITDTNQSRITVANHIQQQTKGWYRCQYFRWRQNRTKKVNNGVSKIRPIFKTNIFPRNNCESLTWSAKSQQKVSIADGQTFSDSIDEKSAWNLNLYYFDAI
jgi:hypothetical protein